MLCSEPLWLCRSEQSVVGRLLETGVRFMFELQLLL